MALVTFTSPMHKDKTVYAVAGSHTQTILSLAKEHHIPIDFGCQEGNCGTCLVKVSSVDAKRWSDGRDGWEIFTHGGRKPTGINAVEHALKLAELGAGSWQVSLAGGRKA